MWGIIEGFYGTPWSWASRGAVCSALASAGMDSYVYAPKDDPLHRQRWREPYGEEFLEQLRSFVEDTELGVGFAISPGLSLDATSRSDRASLLAKYRSVIDQGVASVGIFFDDIPPAKGLGATHAAVTAEIRESLETDVGVFMCPLPYTGTADVEYMSELCAVLPPEVLIAWTGSQVVNDTVTSAEARRWSETMQGRLPLLWDNVPVNDAVMSDTLPLMPLTGRDSDLPEHLSGYLANAMVQAAASVPSLLSAAAWLRGEDPVEAFEAALGAEDSVLAESVAPRRLLDTCDAALDGDTVALADLSDFFEKAAATGDAGFGDEVAPWAAQVRSEASVAQLALAILDPDSPRDARASALVCLMAWPSLRNGTKSVFGGRGGMRPALAHDEAGDWVPGPGCFVEPASIVDRLVASAFDSLGRASG